MHAPRAAVARYLILAGAFLLSAALLPGENPDWGAFAARSTRADDELLVELLLTLPLDAALEVARALPTRPQPALGAIAAGLSRRSAPEPEREPLLLRLMLEALLALPPERRPAALRTNGDTAGYLLESTAQRADPMLEAAVWRLSAALPRGERRALLPPARAAAAHLLERVRESGMDEERAAAGRAFLTYLAATPDETLIVLADAMRESSRHRGFVRQARAVLGRF
jgi:hypothetical protein